MEEHVLLELIDQYILGTISPTDQAYLETLMASDPEIALTIEESKKAFQVLITARNHQLRQKLLDIDQKEAARTGFFPKWLILLTLILLTVTCFWYWAKGFYNPVSIAVRYAERQPVPQGILTEPQEGEAGWIRAKETFRDGAYENALGQFASLAESTDRAVTYTAQWNMLLCRLALHGSSPNWRTDMLTFIKESPDPWSSEAQTLLAFLDSNIYRFFGTSLHTNLSTLKPRLI